MSENVFEGKCIIFSAPSGAGKTTIVKHLLGHNLPLEFSVSACSRAVRGQEVDGKDYYFLGIDGFKSKIEEGAFIEWEEVYPDNFYGTLTSEIDRIWATGKHVLFDLDVVGGLNLKNHFGDKALAIFVKPPNIEELGIRLRLRNTEPEDKIVMRLGKAQKEMESAELFDVIIFNEDLEAACKQTVEVVSKFLQATK
jgi:guanylate kinase